MHLDNGLAEAAQNLKESFPCLNYLACGKNSKKIERSILSFGLFSPSGKIPLPSWVAPLEGYYLLNTR
ncbi:hypothetical protein CEP54_016294 [Fusarium duplospermum]|uniref:Uncharacterized protein n=1 Tax=Fusarium duplospermum TaxID=1325734 RepID=A0A428NFP1_9HYPO|nr:hypothetical protein CEP54_016294 [Fusarium duplospermum]